MFQIKFGTDGWRGRLAEDYTFANLRRCAQGFASYLLDQGYQGEWVVVGYDMRFHSENFAAAVAEVLAGNGLRAYLTQEATPTPVIAYAVVNLQAVGAVNITASHNPPTDNGFKVRNRFGGAIDPAGLLAIESRIPASEDLVKRISLAEAEGKDLVRRFDPAQQYIKQLNRLVDLEPIKDAGLRILVDPMLLRLRVLRALLLLCPLLLLLPRRLRLTLAVRFLFNQLTQRIVIRYAGQLLFGVAKFLGFSFEPLTIPVDLSRLLRCGWIANSSGSGRFRRLNSPSPSSS